MITVKDFYQKRYEEYEKLILEQLKNKEFNSIIPNIRLMKFLNSLMEKESANLRLSQIRGLLVAIYKRHGVELPYLTLSLCIKNFIDKYHKNKNILIDHILRYLLDSKYLEKKQRLLESNYKISTVFLRLYKLSEIEKISK